jgi:hypothetical protein
MNGNYQHSNRSRSSAGWSTGLTTLLATTLLASLALNARAQSSSDYKVPDGFIKAPLEGYTGVLMLQPHRASGMFVVYIENEPIETLKARLLDQVGNMFLDEKSKGSIAWNTRTLTPRLEDGNGEAAMSSYQKDDKQVQVSIYERKTGPRHFIYGYFAMRHRAERRDDGEFLNFDGKGVKAFEKLWKSFPK